MKSLKNSKVLIVLLAISFALLSNCYTVLVKEEPAEIVIVDEYEDSGGGIIVDQQSYFMPYDISFGYYNNPFFYGARYYNNYYHNPFRFRYSHLSPYRYSYLWNDPWYDSFYDPFRYGLGFSYFSYDPFYNNYYGYGSSYYGSGYGGYSPFYYGSVINYKKRDFDKRRTNRLTPSVGGRNVTRGSGNLNKSSQSGKPTVSRSSTGNPIRSTITRKNNNNTNKTSSRAVVRSGTTRSKSSVSRSTSSRTNVSKRSNSTKRTVTRRTPTRSTSKKTSTKTTVKKKKKNSSGNYYRSTIAVRAKRYNTNDGRSLVRLMNDRTRRIIQRSGISSSPIRQLANSYSKSSHNYTRSSNSSATYSSSSRSGSRSSSSVSRSSSGRSSSSRSVTRVGKKKN